MCTGNRFGLAALVGGWFCLLGWLIASSPALGDDANASRTLKRQPENPTAGSSTEAASGRQKSDEIRRDDRDGISLSGKGRQASEKFRLEPGICLFDISHDGSSNLVIKLLDINGKEIDTVFNQIGPFNGERAINIPQGGECLLDVEADGNWKADIRQPRSAEGQTAPCTFEGNGYKTSPSIQLDRGLAEFKMKHDGQQRFKVVLLDQNGRPVEYLANTIGAFDGSKPISIEEPGVYFLNVTADGNWTVDVK
jgi:hypothetical protein